MQNNQPTDIRKFVIGGGKLDRRPRDPRPLSPKEKQRRLDEIQEEIRVTVTPEMMKVNTIENRKAISAIVSEIITKYEPKEFSIRCDASNNTDEVVKNKAFMLEAFIKFDETQGGCKVKLEHRPNPFDNNQMISTPGLPAGDPFFRG